MGNQLSSAADDRKHSKPAEFPKAADKSFSPMGQHCTGHGKQVRAVVRLQPIFRPRYDTAAEGFIPVSRLPHPAAQLE